MSWSMRPGRHYDLAAALTGRPRYELEFLPAAIEIIDTPPPPAARLIPMTICLFCALAVGWSIFGRIDIVANAPGTVLVAGKTRLVEAEFPGLVEKVLVHDGDHVASGQPLITLDTAESVASRDKIAVDLAQADLDVAGLRSLRGELGRSDANRLAFRAPSGATADQVEQEHAAILSRWSEQQAKLDSLNAQIAEKRVEAAENDGNIDRYRATLPMLGGIRSMYRQLFSMQLGSRVDLLNSEEKFTEEVHELAIAVAHGGEAEADIAALRRQYDAQEAEYANGVIKDLSAAEQIVAEKTDELKAASHQVTLGVIHAPLSGTVQQLAVFGSGATVQPGQRLMSIVPDGKSLLVEAMVANKDIGFVRAGQTAKLKVAAFSFTRYGLVSGRVIGISRDAIDDTPQSGGGGAERVSGTMGGSTYRQSDIDGGQGSSYIARIALDRPEMTIDGKRTMLQPGMAVTAEILTGRRRVISYLLSPLSRGLQDAARER